MSLDVYLTISGVQNKESSEHIFIREDGAVKELTRNEWDALYPDREPMITTIESDTNEVFSANITHSLGHMAGEAGIYKCLWRPDEIGISKASQLIEPLKNGLELLRSDPERFGRLNPSNGWGSYGGLVSFVEEYLAACIENPNADVHVSR